MKGRTLKGIYRTYGWMMDDYYGRLYDQGWRMVRSYRDYRGSSAWIAEFVKMEVPA